jgi:5-methylcytosine-specific restriction endonuclease McrA
MRDSVVERDEYTCAYCAYFVGEHAEIDHVMPKALGGLDTPDNLVCACRKCNIWKSDKYPTEFLLELGYQPVHNPTLLRCLDLERLERGITSVTIS